MVYDRLLKKGVTISPLTAVKAVNGRSAMTVHPITKQENCLEGVETVVVAYRGQADDTLYHAVKQRGSEVHLIGDALAPRRLMDVILDGARVGHQV